MKSHSHWLLLAGFLFVAGLYSGQGPLAVHADTTSDLQAQIDTSNSWIQTLKDEINALQSQLNENTKQKQTLQGAVQELNLNIQKLTKSITLTQAEIKQKDQQIGTLSGTISNTAEKIDTSKNEVGGSLRELQSVDSEPVLVTLLGGGTLSSIFDEASALGALRADLEAHIHNLSQLKSGLETDKQAAQKKRSELAALNRDLNDQKQGLVIAKDAQNKLLAETKNKESTYQTQIAQKQALEAKFEQDLLNYEAQLDLAVKAGSFASARPGILHWPVDAPRITQYFGNTDFSTQNPQVYNGHGHNAIDLRASPGTPIKAARDGVVRGLGNTDTACPGASYGKWIFIDHDNGLSTLYAHLATFLVETGDHVTQGQVIAYSDTTGYATGPHLHFGVYASSGAKIASFPSKNCKGRTYTMPVADISAYLNPLSYLPVI